MEMAVLLTAAFTGCSTSWNAHVFAVMLLQSLAAVDGCNTHMLALLLVQLCSTHDVFACQACKAPGNSCCNINAKLVNGAIFYLRKV